MSKYYLMSQLPSLDGISENMPIPISEERFMELCLRFLGKKAQNEIIGLTLAPVPEGEKSSSALVDAWNERERNLRIALAQARADKMKKVSDTENRNLPPELIKVAATAVEINDPLEAEKYLSNHRLAFLETLRPADIFAEDSVYYYGLKLKLLLRIRQFDTEAGKIAYKNIYTSIMNGYRLEDTQ